jgi:hypothetical protein
LVVSETGEDSGLVGLKGQARCLDMTLVRGAAVKLKGIIWWTFKDYPPNGWYYGLVNDAFQPKPSYDALQTLASELNGYKFKGNFTNKPGFGGLEAYRFKQGDEFKFVVWAATFTPPPVPELYYPPCSWLRHKKLATFDATELRVVEFLGKVKNITDNSPKDKDPALGRIAIMVKSAPRIVEINP